MTGLFLGSFRVLFLASSRAFILWDWSCRCNSARPPRECDEGKAVIANKPGSHLLRHHNVTLDHGRHGRLLARWMIATRLSPRALEGPKIRRHRNRCLGHVFRHGLGDCKGRGAVLR